jgi:hypothetical protein
LSLATLCFFPSVSLLEAVVAFGTSFEPVYLLRGHPPVSQSSFFFIFFIFFFALTFFEGGALFLVAKFRAPKGRICRPLGCFLCGVQHFWLRDFACPGDGFTGRWVQKKKTKENRKYNSKKTKFEKKKKLGTRKQS